MYLRSMWNRSVTVFLWALTLLLLGGSVGAQDLPSGLKIRPGERLVYELRWSVFPVARAVLSLDEAELNGEKVWKITLLARTNAFADTFYKVRNRSVSYVNWDFTHALRWEESQHEGDTDRELVLEFYWDQNLVKRHRVGEELPALELLPGTFDPLSVVYAVRNNFDFAHQTSASYPTTSGKRMLMTDIERRGEKKLKVDAGRFQCWIIDPDTKDLGGVFNKSKNASIRFWFDKEANHYPVKMQSEVVVGSFWAELVEIQYGTEIELSLED
jgi:hypothetical protein